MTRHIAIAFSLVTLFVLALGLMKVLSSRESPTCPLPSARTQC